MLDKLYPYVPVAASACMTIAAVMQLTDWVIVFAAMYIVHGKRG